MDEVTKLLEALQAGERVVLQPAGSDTLDDAHAYVDKLEKVYELKIERMARISHSGPSLLIWLPELRANPIDEGFMVSRRSRGKR